MQPRVGDFIEVYWPLDKAYYRGEVTALEAGHTKLLYDDGDTEELRLGGEKWRFSANKAESPAVKGVGASGDGQKEDDGQKENDKDADSDHSMAADDGDYEPSGEDEVDLPAPKKKGKGKAGNKATHAGRITKTSEPRATRRTQKKLPEGKEDGGKKKQVDIAKTGERKLEPRAAKRTLKKQPEVKEDGGKKKKVDIAKTGENELDGTKKRGVNVADKKEESDEQVVRDLAAFLAQGEELEKERYGAIREALKPHEEAIREAGGRK